MRPASLLYHCLRVLGDFMLKSNDIISGPCSGKKFDINFGNRLYSKEKRPGSPLLF